MQPVTADSKRWEKHLGRLMVEGSQLKSIVWKAFLMAIFIAIVPGVESFVLGFFDGLEERR